MPDGYGGDSDNRGNGVGTVGIWAFGQRFGAFLSSLTQMFSVDKERVESAP